MSALDDDLLQPEWEVSDDELYAVPDRPVPEDDMPDDLEPEP